jgi:hypothetical protein
MSSVGSAAVDDRLTSTGGVGIRIVTTGRFALGCGWVGWLVTVSKKHSKKETA